MMSKFNHLIRRKKVALHASTGDGFELKKKIETLMHELAEPMSTMFDELSGENEWLQIDKINIEINGLNSADFGKAIQSKILMQLGSEIEARKFAALQAGSTDANPTRLISGHQRTLDAFIFFLQHGILPWWLTPVSHSEFEKQILESLKIKSADSKGEIRSGVLLTLQNILASPEASSRLAVQFSHEIFLAVLRNIKHSSRSVTDLWIDIFCKLTEIISASSGEPRLQKIFNEHKIPFLFSFVNENKEVLPLKLWFRNFIIAMRDSGYLKVIDRISSEPLIRQSGIFIIEESELNRNKSKHQMRQRRSGLEQEKLFPEKRNDRASASEIFPAEDYFSKSEGELISNAGAIIVAPFLAQLFEECKLIHENKITDTNKAIALIHYLVYGNCDYKEYDVLLNKILCAVEPSSTITIIDSLTEHEMKCGDEMLDSVIEHWTALKNTSRDGLREGFLQRSGKMLHQYDGWLMNVEQKTIDILMKQIPWTIGFIKLPWMNEMIRIEWI